jgi:dihydropyrimidinase
VDDRIGPYQLADTYATATAQGLRNGVTTLCTFVTQGPGRSLRQAMVEAYGKALGRTHADVLWHLTPTTFAEADYRFLEALPRTGYRTLKLYTTYRPAGLYASYERLAEAFDRLRETTFLVHCEDDRILSEVDASALDLSLPSSHAQLRPEPAEFEAIHRVAGLARDARVPLHVVHVSTVEGARILYEAKRKADITCETCPQYLLLDATWLDREDGHRWICSPPLREGREAFRALAREEAFDLVATDHCPFRPEDKDAWDGTDVRRVPGGLPGIGALPHVTWKIWEDDPDRSALGLATFLSAAPARRAGVGDRKGAILPGRDADLVVLDPKGPERPIRSAGVPVHEPFPGFTSKLAFRAVLLRGIPRVKDGVLLEPGRPAGVPLQPDPETLPTI